MRGVFKAASWVVQAMREKRAGTLDGLERAAHMYGEAAVTLRAEARTIRNPEVRDQVLERAEHAARAAASCWDELGHQYFAAKLNRRLH